MAHGYWRSLKKKKRGEKKSDLRWFIWSLHFLCKFRLGPVYWMPAWNKQERERKNAHEPHENQPNWFPPEKTKKITSDDSKQQRKESLAFKFRLETYRFQCFFLCRDENKTLKRWAPNARNMHTRKTTLFVVWRLSMHRALRLLSTFHDMNNAVRRSLICIFLKYEWKQKTEKYIEMVRARLDLYMVWWCGFCVPYDGSTQQ